MHRPRELNLTASDELLAIEHEEVLRFNGFEIEVDEDAQAGQRIKLVAMPVSKATKKTEFTMQGRRGASQLQNSALIHLQ